MRTPMTGDVSPVADARTLVESRYEVDAAARELRIRLGQVDEGSVEVVMECAPHMVNGHGIIHGGYIFALGDTCFAYVCEAKGTPAVTRQADITFIAPGAADSALVARGTEVTCFGRNNIVDISITDAAGRQVAEMRVHGVVKAKKEVQECRNPVPPVHG